MNVIILKQIFENGMKIMDDFWMRSSSCMEIPDNLACISKIFHLKFNQYSFIHYFRGTKSKNSYYIRRAIFRTRHCVRTISVYRLLRLLWHFRTNKWHWIRAHTEWQLRSVRKQPTAKQANWIKCSFVIKFDLISCLFFSVQLTNASRVLWQCSNA